MLSALDFDLHDRAAIGGEAIVDGFGRRGCTPPIRASRRLPAVLLLILAQHAIECAIARCRGQRVRRCADAHGGGTASSLIPESPVTVTFPTRARGPETTRKSMSASCCSGCGVTVCVIVRFEIAILLKRRAHLVERPKHFGRGQACAGVRAALRAPAACSSLAPVAPSTPTVPMNVRGVPTKVSSTPSALARAFHFNGVVQSAGVELAQTRFQIFRGERRCPNCLSQVAGERIQPVGRNAFEGDAADGQASQKSSPDLFPRPPRNGAWHRTRNLARPQTQRTKRSEQGGGDVGLLE